MSVPTSAASKRAAILAAAALATIVAGRADAVDVVWDNTSNDFLWDPASPTNWLADALPGAADRAQFLAPGIGTVSLNGGTRTVDTLQFDADTATNYTIGNGTLILNRIQQDSDDDNVINAAVTAAGTQLELNSTDNQVIFNGVVTTTDLLKLGGARVSLRNVSTATPNAISGTITMNGGQLEPRASYTAGVLGSGLGGVGAGARPLVLTSGNLDLRGDDTANAGLNNTFALGNAVTVNGNVTIDTRRFGGSQLGKTFALGPLSMGAFTLTTSGGEGYMLSLAGAALTGNATISVANNPTTIAGNTSGAFSLTKTGAGELVLGGTGGHTDTVINVGLVTLNSNAALGTGNLLLNRGGSLRFGVPQATLPTLSVVSGAGVGGDMTGYIYSGVGQNITIAPGAHFGPFTANAPTRTSLGLAAGAPTPYYSAILANTGAFVEGDDPTEGDANLYRGIAFTGFQATGDFQGDLSQVAGQDLDLYVSVGKNFRPSASSGGNVPTFNASTGIANVYGPGEFRIQANGAQTFDGTVNTFNRIGEANMQNIQTMRFDDANAIPAGKTFNLVNGRLDLEDVNVVNAGAVVNINSGGMLALDQTVTTGTYNINNGGALRPSDATRLTGTATINFNAGSIVVLDLDVPDLVTAKIPTNGLVDFMVSEDTFGTTGGALVLGNNRRLTSGHAEGVSLVAGTNVQPIAGLAAIPNNRVILSAGTGDTFTFNNPMNFTGVNIQMNDPVGFVPSNMLDDGNDNTRATVAQQGNYSFKNTFRAASVTLEGTGTAGQLSFDHADTNVAGDVLLKAGVMYLGVGGPSGNTAPLTDRLISTTGLAADRVAGNIVMEAETRTEVGLRFDATPAANGQVEVTQPFVINGVSPSDERRLYVSKRLGTTDVVMPVTFTNITLGEGAGFGIDEDTGTNVKAAARADLKLMGDATFYEIDDWDIDDLVRHPSAAAGTSVVTWGPINTTTNASTGILNSSVFGTLGSDVRVNIQSGQLFFRDGSILNGVVDTTASSHVNGDSFVTFGGAANADTIVNGTGEVRVGISPDGTEDVRILINDVDAGQTPLVTTVMPTIRVVNDGNDTNNDGSIQAGRTFTGPGSATDIVDRAVSGIGIYRSIVLDPGSRATFTRNDGTWLTVHNIKVATASILTADNLLSRVSDTTNTTDVHLDFLGGAGRLNTNGGGGSGVDGVLGTGDARSMIVLGTNRGDSDVLAPGDSVGTLSVESLRLEDGFTLAFEADDTAGDAVAVLDNPGFDISNDGVDGLGQPLASASIETTFLGSTPLASYVLFTWLGTDPITGVTTTQVMPNWVLAPDGDLTGIVEYRPGTNEIVLTNVELVPEPGALGLLGLGTAALMGQRRRRTLRD